MKALCIRQPWASLIAKGIKTIELRTWKTSYRGSLLILSSASGKTGLPSGGTICIADLVDIRAGSVEDTAAACCVPRPNEFAWVLRNAHAVPFAKVKGRLGLFDLDVPTM
jgi:hypothetical protein